MTTNCKIRLVNGAEVEVSKEEVDIFITQTPSVPGILVCGRTLLPNPYWRHSKQLTEGEVMRYLQGKSQRSELLSIAKYILVHAENTSFSAYLFGGGDAKEFNMPVLYRLREIYQKMTDASHIMIDIAPLVHEMENLCMEIGLDPLWLNTRNSVKV